MNKKLITSIVIIVLLGTGLFYLTNTKKQNQTNKSTLLGCYVAKIAKDIYTLNIQSVNGESVSGILAYNNYQKDSSSGTFSGTFSNDLLIGNYVFDSEGMKSTSQVVFKKDGDNFIQGFGPINVDINENKITFKDLAGLSFEPKLSFIKLENCISQFVEINNVFTFDYNPFFQAFELENLPTEDWRSNSGELGLILSRVIIPKSYMTGTNFSEALITIGRSATPKSIGSCTNIDKSVGETEMEVITIGGYPFKKFISNGAAAGNFYETTSYRGIVDGDCYVIESKVHSTNIGNYLPDQNIVEFNKIKIENEINEILKSFKFLISSD
jgi:hypothetical protein